ncbi:hypothetical protein [Paenibacillus xylaniclasticus]|uniref:hypothetical protein n=1 Tax=Paenibacillus xylaniclasticus TaxID=588083 RepID=UPI000FDAE6CC|nr:MULTISPECIES: hypothetical protein [Paenibacillus]GFN32390.1 hypothetical protein PCURB6_26500 [Paenibacillus curdlanolyticus]
MKNQKTLKSKRIYLTYLDNSGDEITLSFRDENAMNYHISANKITENRIKYRGYVSPKDLMGLPSKSAVYSAISLFESCYGLQEEF